ncbi:hypothetical protein ABZS88_38695 [Streptomyces sp. NPDC005480]|uniref:hypothetical protein n=1 Tax=Streptomyces sp. NPDC005480 TaxID=3154880 RepID=UPI0033A0B6B9
MVDNYRAPVVGSVLLGFAGDAQLVQLSFLRRHLAGDAVATAVTVLIMATGSGVALGDRPELPAPAARESRGAQRRLADRVFALILLSLSAPPDTAVGDAAFLLLIVGIVAAVAWGVVERRFTTPVFDLAVLKKAFVTTACLSAGFFGAVDAAFLSFGQLLRTDPREADRVRPEHGRAGDRPHQAAVRRLDVHQRQGRGEAG